MAYILIPATIAIMIFTGSVIFHGGNYSAPTDQPVTQTETQPVEQTYQPNPASSENEAPFPVDQSRQSEPANPVSAKNNEKPAKTNKTDKSDAAKIEAETKAIEAETRKLKSQTDSEAKRIEADIQTRLDESQRIQEEIAKEEQARDANNAKLAEQRKAELANQANLAEQQKADAIAAAEKKYQQCKKDLQNCMNDIGSKIMGLSGSAYSSAAKALGDSCNRKYSCK